MADDAVLSGGFLLKCALLLALRIHDAAGVEALPCV
jgi:hypothetical protein